MSKAGRFLTNTPETLLKPDSILGQVIANYPSDRLRWVLIFWSLLAVSGFTVSATIGNLPYDWAPIAAMLIMAALTMLISWRALHSWNREIVLYEYGFSYREGGAEIQFIYAEITSIRLKAEQRSYFGGIFKRNFYRFTVFTINAETFVITNLYRRTSELGAKLQERVNRELRPTIARRLAVGDAVLFSDTLRLSETGLHESGRDLAWDQYGGYQLGGGNLSLFTVDKSLWFSLPLPEFDNITILLDLLKDYGAKAASQKR